MKLILAIFVSIVILIISATLFSLLGLKLKGESSLINIIIQITPVIIGFSLIRYSWKKITYSEESKDNILDSSQLLVKAVVNHGKEIVQDVKPAINNYIEKHSTDEIIVSNSMDKEEHMKCEDINEDEIYDNVMLEIEEDKKIRSTWAKALSLSDGDENKANSLYIKLRVDFLIQEKKNIIENEKKKIEEQELFLKQEKERLDKEKLEEERIKQEKLDFEKKEKLKEEKRIEAENVENYEKSLKNDIANIIKEHTKKETPIIGKLFYKVEDRNIMFTKLVNKIQEPLNSQLNEITHLKRENAKLQNENSKMVQKDLQNQKLIRNLELEKTQNKQIIDKQNKKINKLQNKSLILISFFKSLGLKINDFKKYFKSQKQQQKSYFIDR